MEQAVRFAFGDLHGVEGFDKECTAGGEDDVEEVRVYDGTD